MSLARAAELGGRLAWTCNSLFSRCGCAYLVPILRRADNPSAWMQVNNRLRRALQWWRSYLASPVDALSHRVSAQPRSDTRPPAVMYTDASTDFGLGAVLLLPLTHEAFFL